MSYTEIGGALTEDTTLTAGTYLLTSDVTLSSYKLTFDCGAGSIFIKSNNCSITADHVGIIASINTSSTNRVIFTSKNDNGRGEVIAGSTGIPLPSDQQKYFIGFLWPTIVVLVHIDLQWAEFHYAKSINGLIIASTITGSRGRFTLKHIYIYNCIMEITVESLALCFIGHLYSELFTYGVLGFTISDISIDTSNIVLSVGATLINLPSCEEYSTIKNIFIDLAVSQPVVAISASIHDSDILVENVFCRGDSISGVSIVSGVRGDTPESKSIVRSVVVSHPKYPSSTLGDGVIIANLAGDHDVEVYNCIFDGFIGDTGCFQVAPFRMDSDTSLDEHNNVFNNVDQIYIIIDGVTPVITHDPSDIVADPEFGSIPFESIIDDECVFPHGLAVTNLASLEYRGSEVYADYPDPYNVNNTPTGYTYKSTDQFTAGIIYKLQAAIPPTITTSPIFIDEPNWAYPVSVIQSFDTSIFISKFQKEQRRPLRESPQRTVSFVIDKFTNRAELEMYLEQYKNIPVVVPLYNEPMLLSDTGSLIGKDSFTTQRDTSYLYNLQNSTDYVVFIDIAREVSSELVALDFALGLTLSTTALTVALLGERSVVYPAMLGYLISVKFIDITDDKISVSLTFVES